MKPRGESHRGECICVYMDGVRLAVVIPVLNEENDIEMCLESIVNQTRTAEQIIVLDGGSTDSTREIVARFKEIHLVDNPGRTVSCARNLALDLINDDITHLFEMIGHAVIPSNHLELRLEQLRPEIGALGTRVLPGRTTNAKSIWIEGALSSPIGRSSGQFARFKGMQQTKVPAFAIHSRKAIEEVGGWDENLITSQDSDLSMRMIKSGWKIWRSDVSFVRMAKRSSLRDWWLMSHRYGFWRTKILLRHPSRINPLEFLPLFGLSVLILLLWLGQFWQIPLILYGIVLLSEGIRQSIRHPSSFLGVPLCLLILHISFSIGLLDGLIRKGRESGDRTNTR